MSRLALTLGCALSVAACAATKPLPTHLDPSNPAAAAAPAHEASRALSSTPHAHEAPAPGTARYACPHHPEVTSDVPGTCPKCHMALEAQSGDGDAAGPQYACPHHPEVTSNAPGTCPKCHMALELQAGELAATPYACPHHPEVTANAPGTCPKCHMALEPQAPAAHGATPVHGAHPGPGTP